MCLSDYFSRVVAKNMAGIMHDRPRCVQQTLASMSANAEQTTHHNTVKINRAAKDALATVYVHPANQAIDAWA